MSDKAPAFTRIPGRKPIELVAYYDEFAWYYPNCEPETKRWFVEHVEADWTIIDAGANVGYFSILFSQLAPKGRVFAFEPTSTAEMLERNLQHHGVRNVEVCRIALGAASGDLEDRIFRLWGQEPEVNRYPFCRIDDFVAQRGLSRVDCIKIDVDSFDFDVLRGAEETLDRMNPWVVVELNHALSRRVQSNMEALEWLASLGYDEALVLDNDNFVLRRKARDAAAPRYSSQGIALRFAPDQSVFDELSDSGVESVAVRRQLAIDAGSVEVPASNAPSEGRQRKKKSLARKLRRKFKRLTGLSGKKSRSAGVAAEITRPVSDIEGAAFSGSSIRSSFGKQVSVTRRGYLISDSEAGANLLSFSLEADLRERLANGMVVVVELEVKPEASAGAVCIFTASADNERQTSHQRIVRPSYRKQRVCLVPYDSRDTARVVFRNTADAGASTMFEVLSVTVVDRPVPSAWRESAIAVASSDRLSVDALREMVLHGAAVQSIRSAKLRTAPGRELEILPLERLPERFPNAPKFEPPAKKALPSWRMEEDDAPILSRILRAHAPRRHLEFGTWQGFGAMLVARETAADVWTINLPHGEDSADGRWAYGSAIDTGGLPEELRAEAEWVKAKEGAVRTDSGAFIGWIYRAAGYEDRVHQILANSCDLDMATFEAGFFDSAFVDGGHSYEVVVNDTEKALRWVRPGGLIIWHDFCPDPEVLLHCSSPIGVIEAIVDKWDELEGQLEELYWIRPSWMLVGRKRQ